MLSRYSDFPATGPRELPAEERNLVTHAELSIIAGHVLMAMDILRSMGQETRIHNNTSVCLDLDSREEANRVYGALSEGRSEGSLMADMPWGAYWGVILDRYGIRWMVNQPWLLNDRQLQDLGERGSLRRLLGADHAEYLFWVGIVHYLMGQR